MFRNNSPTDKNERHLIGHLKEHGTKHQLFSDETPQFM